MQLKSRRYNQQMIEQVWNKKIVAIIQMAEEDIADEKKPLPLIIDLAWNAYVGVYHNIIINFFQMYAPFPLKIEQFGLRLKNNTICPTEIVYHLLENYQLSPEQPLQLTCYFRSRAEVPQIDLRRHYKNALKASTALKYGKYGASIMTVQMSISNVEDMVDGFMANNYHKFLGSTDFTSDSLGYTFLVHKTDKIAVKFISKDILVQRVCEKDVTFQNFVQNLFGKSLTEILDFRICMISMKGCEDIKMGDLEKYAHPDGYLYIHL